MHYFNSVGGRMRFVAVAPALVLLFILVSALTTGCGGDSSPVASIEPISKAGTVTAQSIGIDFHGIPVSLEIGQDTAWWTYDRDAAATYFVVASTVGGPNSGQIGAAFVEVVNQNRCTFWTGGALSGTTKTFGAKSVTIAPVGSGTVSAATAWVLDSTHYGGGSLPFRADFAGESVVHRDEGPWLHKYSFSLDEDGVTRVVDAAYILEVSDGAGGWSEVERYLVGEVTDLESGTWAHHYIGNAGTFGAGTEYLIDGMSQGDIMDNSDNLTGDDFDGNNSNLSPDSDGNAMLAHGPSYGFTFPGSGTYRIRVVATVKENSGSAVSSPFTVTGAGGGTLNVGIGNCGN